MKGNQGRKKNWLMLALHLLILLNISTAKSSFESLLKEYSKFKEKQMAKKARKLLGKHSSLRMTKEKKHRSRRLEDKKSSEIFDGEVDGLIKAVVSILVK